MAPLETLDAIQADTETLRGLLKGKVHDDDLLTIQKELEDISARLHALKRVALGSGQEQSPTAQINIYLMSAPFGPAHALIGPVDPEPIR